MAEHDSAAEPSTLQDERAAYVDDWRDRFVEQRLVKPPRDIEEAEVVSRLCAVLERAGWQCQREVSLPRVRLRPDIVVRHPLLPFPGIVECKAQIREPAQATAVLKQASDYVGNLLPDGERIEFGAVCPWQPPAEAECGSGCTMWGMLHVMATQFKVFAFISDETFARWNLAKGKRHNFRFSAQRLLLMSNEQIRVWCNERWFVSNATQILGGRRQVGGVRK